MTGMLITIKPLRWMDKSEEGKRACNTFEFMNVFGLWPTDNYRLLLRPALGVCCPQPSRAGCENQQLALNCALEVY